ncbi:MAG: GyrI-like domain-containing protein [Ignavibacteriae bacterium]|nr:GyrI-like domain-containing protein [Ignavibacteriota bacterium]
MKKLDLKTTYKQLYKATAGKCSVVTIPNLRYLMIDGTGDPNTSQQFAEAIQSLYSTAYTLKFTIKKKKEIEYPVMPLEGLWWMEEEPFDMYKKDKWKWTLMILQPEIISDLLVQEAKNIVAEKKKLASVSGLRLEHLDEQTTVQTLHIGSYSEETPTIINLHKFAEEQGYALRGKHHEIYLSDPRKTATEKLKTIIRHPVRKK